MPQVDGRGAICSIGHGPPRPRDAPAGRIVPRGRPRRSGQPVASWQILVPGGSAFSAVETRAIFGSGGSFASCNLGRDEVRSRARDRHEVPLNSFAAVSNSAMNGSIAVGAPVTNCKSLPVPLRPCRLCARKSPRKSYRPRLGRYYPRPPSAACSTRGRQGYSLSPHSCSERQKVRAPALASRSRCLET